MNTYTSSYQLRRPREVKLKKSYTCGLKDLFLELLKLRTINKEQFRHTNMIFA